MASWTLNYDVRRLLIKMSPRGSSSRVAAVALLLAPTAQAYSLAAPSRNGRVQMVAAADASPLSAAELRAAPNPIAKPGEELILLRAAKGEVVSRPPVWLMRQAGRYMASFREYSENYEFRMRSETPDIAIELSLQPWKAFGVDGVIMFSDILTPLPAMGIEFDVIRGKGPVISSPLRTMADVAALTPLEDPLSKLPFINTILGDLKKETAPAGQTLVGFVGSPFTLVAYSVEGSANRHCINTKKMMTQARARARSGRPRYPRHQPSPSAPAPPPGCARNPTFFSQPPLALQRCLALPPTPGA